MRQPSYVTSPVQRVRGLIAEYQQMRWSFQAAFRTWPLVIFWNFLSRTRLAEVWSRLQSALSLLGVGHPLFRAELNGCGTDAERCPQRFAPGLI